MRGPAQIVPQAVRRADTPFRVEFAGRAPQRAYRGERCRCRRILTWIEV